MTLEQFDAAVNSLLDSVPAMTLATSSGSRPWASDVYFAPSGYELIFFSSPASRHSLNLVANPYCAATVHPQAATWREIRGLQIEGTAAPITGIEETAQAILVYSAKFSFARDLMWNPFEIGKEGTQRQGSRVSPGCIHYLDNALGFGIAILNSCGERQGHRLPRARRRPLKQKPAAESSHLRPAVSTPIIGGYTTQG